MLNGAQNLMLANRCERRMLGKLEIHNYCLPRTDIYSFSRTIENVCGDGLWSSAYEISWINLGTVYPVTMCKKSLIPMKLSRCLIIGAKN